MTVVVSQHHPVALRFLFLIHKLILGLGLDQNSSAKHNFDWVAVQAFEFGLVINSASNPKAQNGPEALIDTILHVREIWLRQ